MTTDPSHLSLRHTRPHQAAKLVVVDFAIVVLIGLQKQVQVDHFV
jgi:hypothetical protein